MPKLKTPKIDPLTANQNTGRNSNDVEVRIGRMWITATSIRTTMSGVLFWTSEYFKGNSPESMWKWVA